MLSQTVECPKCQTHVTTQGNPGETISLSCPNCTTKGTFTFPKDTPEIKTISENNIIEVKNLTKMFHEFKALDTISFTVKKGEIIGFVGPNGAGKTTTIKLLTNLLTPTSGNAYIHNIDVNKHPNKAILSVG